MDRLPEVKTEILQKAARQAQETLEALQRKPETRQTAEKNDGTQGPPEKYSIGKTTDNKPFVEVEQDILAGVPEKDWVKTVKENLGCI